MSAMVIYREANRGNGKPDEQRMLTVATWSHQFPKDLSMFEGGGFFQTCPRVCVYEFEALTKI